MGNLLYSYLLFVTPITTAGCVKKFSQVQNCQIGTRKICFTHNVKFYTHGFVARHLLSHIYCKIFGPQITSVYKKDK